MSRTEAIERLKGLISMDEFLVNKDIEAVKLAIQDMERTEMHIRHDKDIEDERHMAQ